MNHLRWQLFDQFLPIKNGNFIRFNLASEILGYNLIIYKHSKKISLLEHRSGNSSKNCNFKIQKPGLGKAQRNN